MRRLLITVAFVLVCQIVVWTQATSIQTSGTLPANCTVGNIYLKTGASAGFYICLATNTWSGPVALGGGGTALDDILAAAGANTIASGNNHSQIWNWALTSDAVNAVTFGETTAAANGTSDNQVLFGLNTLATSTALPLYIKNYGAKAGLRIDDVSGDTTPFLVDADGEVCIGCTGPTEALTVAGSVTVTGGYLNSSARFLANEIGTTGSNNLLLTTNTGATRGTFRQGTNRLEISNNGNTSISATNEHSLTINSDGANEYFTLGFGFDGGAVPAYLGYRETSNTGFTFGDLVFGTRAVTTSTAPSERMRIDTQGTVIIPSTTPTPAVSNTSANSCGTTAATIAGNNNLGTVTVGATSGTDCTLTFTTTAPVEWICMVNNATTANLARAVPTSTTTTRLVGTFVAGDALNYMCFAR